MNSKQHPSERPTVACVPSASTTPPTLRIAFGAQTHFGKVRPNNEDQYLIVRACKSLEILSTSLPVEQLHQLPDREGYCLLVADGMGGHAGGELASALVVNEALAHIVETAKWFFRLDDPDENVRLRLLRESLERMDEKLIDQARKDPALTGMGTTLTAASIVGADAFLVHVGDSRAYLLRAGKLEQLTRDHTRAQDMVERGLLRPEEARTTRLRHVLTNVLGGIPGVEGEILKFRLLDGDRLLLCTDGLTEPVREEQLTEILLQHPEPQEACLALVQAALDRGGPDNITVVLAACSAAQEG